MLSSNPSLRSRRVLLATGLALLAGVAVAGAPEPPVEARDQGVDDTDLVPPRVVDAPAPVFPYHGRRSDLDEGSWVVLLVDVDAQGKPGKATVEHTALGPAYRAQALKAVKRWTFEPATRDGVAVPQSVRVPIVFEMPMPHHNRDHVNSVEPLALQTVRPAEGEKQQPSAGIKPD